MRVIVFDRPGFGHSSRPRSGYMDARRPGRPGEKGSRGSTSRSGRPRPFLGRVGRRGARWRYPGLCADWFSPRGILSDRPPRFHLDGAQGLRRSSATFSATPAAADRSRDLAADAGTRSSAPKPCPRSSRRFRGEMALRRLGNIRASAAEVGAADPDAFGRRDRYGDHRMPRRRHRCVPKTA